MKRASIWPLSQFVGALLFGGISVAFAGPVGGPAHVIQVRPYANSGAGAVYIQLDSNALCGTSVFVIDLSRGAGKEMTAAAMTALVAGKPVLVEASNTTGCAGWGTQLQSIYVNHQ